MDKGLIHLYYGNGKGKTTAAVGLCVRAAGYGFRILVYQFLKRPDSGEVSVLRSLPTVEYMENTIEAPFFFSLTEEETSAYVKLYEDEFSKISEKILSGQYDLCILDEVMDAVFHGLIDGQKLLELLEKKPPCTELVLTGHKNKNGFLNPFIEKADYVTCFQKEKHPYDEGISSRTGIEQ